MISSTPRLKVDGSDLSQGLADRLVGLEVVLSTRRPDTATLELVADVGADGAVLFDQSDFDVFGMGTEVKVSLTEGDAAATEVFTGEVVELGVEQTPKGAVVTVEVVGPGHRLRSTAVPRTFLEQTTKDVVTAIAGDHGLTPEIDAGAAKVNHAYLATSVSDHRLLDQLARQLGFEWWTHEKTLHFRPRPAVAAKVTIERDDVMSASVRYDGRDAPKSVSVTSWDPVKSEPIVVKGSAGDIKVALGSDAAFVTDRHKEVESTFKGSVTVAELHTESREVADIVASGVQRQLLARGLRLELTTIGAPKLTAGEWCKLAGFGDKLSGAYYLTEVRHTFGEGQDLLTSVVGQDGWHPDELTDPQLSTPGSGAWSSRGPVPGVVTDLADPDGLGRVKVKFPSLGDEIGSTWARVVAPGAGGDRGLDLRPRLDDEVLVAFAHGDHAQPYVLGGLWSKKNKHADPESAANGEPTRDGLRSKDGALVTLHTKEDKDGDGREHPGAWSKVVEDFEGAVSLRSGKLVDSGLLIADGVVLCTEGKDILLTTGEASIRLAGDGKITIEGTDLELKLTGACKVEADGDLKAKAKNVDLEAMANATVKAGTKATVEGPAGIALKSPKIDMGP